MYKTDCVSDVKKDFLETLDKCQEVTYADCRNVNVFVRMIRALLRLFAPLM